MFVAHTAFGTRPSEARRRIGRCLLALPVFLTLAATAARCETGGDGLLPANWGREQRYHATLLGAAAGVTALGVANWGYGSRAPYLHSEGWFGAGTAHGGADKAGHFYTSYLLANALPPLYRSWGFDDAGAARRGWLTSVGVMSYMEVGDAFSHFGFSYEDFVMNLLGASSGYCLDRSEYWNQRLAVRLDYLPRLGQSRFPTDYEHSGYLVALRLDSVLGEQPKIWRFLDLEVGYLARGYEQGGERQRQWFVGVGLNFEAVAQWLGWHKTARVLHYWQPVSIEQSHHHWLNQ